MAEVQERQVVPKSSSRAMGPGRLLIAVYAVFALAATARSVVQVTTRFSEAPVAFSLSVVAAIIYLVATISLAKRGRTAYLVSWITITIELAGVIIIGTLSLLAPSLFPAPTVWSEFGIGYLFIPLVLPILGMAWLWKNREGA